MRFCCQSTDAGLTIFFTRVCRNWNWQFVLCMLVLRPDSYSCACVKWNWQSEREGGAESSGGGVELGARLACVC